MQPIPPISREEVGYGHLCPRPVDHLELKRLQSQIPTGDPRVGILHAVEPLEGRVFRTESEFPTQEVIPEGEDGPPNGQTLFFQWCCIWSLSLRASNSDTAPAVPLLRPPGPGPHPAPCPTRPSATKRGDQSWESAGAACRRGQSLPWLRPVGTAPSTGPGQVLPFY